MRVLVIIPAFNEAEAIAQVIQDIPRGLVTEVVVVNNASTDATEKNASRAGATVLYESRRGYGYACLRGLAYASSRNPDVIVFLDGDYSDHPDEMSALIAPILAGTHDLVVGSRIRGVSEHGALLPQARWGNRLACLLMRLLWGAHYSDLGPFRAIRYQSLMKLHMRDATFGWTIEMQIKAHIAGLRITEIPVSYRRRVGVSKITGSLAGAAKASVKILGIIFRFAIISRHLRRRLAA
ncbi:MAG: glycosyltransferase family 2 protein [Rhodothermaceae bacterium]|nr:glycosyltransferase family 2 protein [Rhodothermaceae bacterium]MXZ58783.1 glycosyltransferase family 2 protein [Rhodothermaceae bacterium]MYB92209.1 glycosyltransferase family 2 protein [Rhodothermaceae bacterium]MYD67286.1 glycosyltransferase family 2 protein [Rhodothermaceae bacterium]MYG44754.1 glycosyltransferase family 2 protein [Rhodothermaceae bacterium]